MRKNGKTNKEEEEEEEGTYKNKMQVREQNPDKRNYQLLLTWPKATSMLSGPSVSANKTWASCASKSQRDGCHEQKASRK
jgi:hypothetical protein